MSYLLDLVKSLNQEELNQFRLLDVIGREEDVRDAYAKFAGTESFNETELPAKLQLSKTHFDKITSTLLAKIIYKLWGNDYKQVLDSLQNKGLMALLTHYLKVQEKKVMKAGDRAQAIVFYKQIFDVLRSMFHPQYDSKRTHEFRRRYLTVLGSQKRFEDEVEVTMMAFYGDITEARAKGTEKQELPKIGRGINRWRKKVLEAKNPVAECFYWLAYATLVKYDENPNQFISAVEAGLKAFTATKGKLDKKWKGLLLAESAFGVLSINKYKKALAQYDKLMEEFPDTYRQHIYHQFIWFNCAVLCKQFEKAHQIFAECFEPRIRPDTIPIILFESYALGLLLAIHERDKTAATAWYKKLISVPSNGINPASKLILRLYETLYFYFTGDEETALRFSAKHLKYFKSIDTEAVISVCGLECINLFVRYQRGDTHLFAKTEEAVGKLYRGMNALYHEPLREEWLRIKGGK